MRIEDVHTKISRVFKQAEQNKLAVKKESGLIDYKTPEKSIHSMADWIAKKYGEEDIRKNNPKNWNGGMIEAYLNHRIEQFKSGDIKAGTLKKDVHAINSFKHFARETNVFNHQRIRLGDHEKHLEKLAEEGVIRTKDHHGMITDLDTAKKVRDEIATNGRFGTLPREIATGQLLCGSRIAAECRLRVKDIDLNGGTVYYRADKGDKSRYVPLSGEAKAHYAAQCAGKSPNDYVYQLKDEKGNIISPTKFEKNMQNLITDASKKLGLTSYRKTETGKQKISESFTSHSFRRAYAQDAFKATKNDTREELEKKIRTFTHLQRGEANNIRDRIEREVWYLDRYNREKYEKQHGDLKGYEPKITDLNLRALYVSLLLGHSRVDVLLRHYVDKKK